MKDYGKELIIDLHNCKNIPFTRKTIRKYFKELCELIDMDRETLHWWDYYGFPEEYKKAPSHLKGITAVQFIKTSNIVVHSLDDLGRIYINIFSCKNFDAKTVIKFSKNWFNGKVVNTKTIRRI